MSTLLPTHIMILGGGGDLAQRKLFPSLLTLFMEDKLPKSFHITGLARTERTDDEYRAFVIEAIKRNAKVVNTDKLHAFCSKISYVNGALDDETSYDKLKEKMRAFSKEADSIVNTLFYLAVPPQQYEITFKQLHKSNIALIKDKDPNWARILVEKPFGNNFDTALELDALLGSLFAEEQIYRIDHYLAKEAVQNILSFRFANVLLQTPWNKDNIKEVRITMHESIDVKSRGSFYDAVGALRDVGQNHLLQILALIAMDEPKNLTAQEIRSKRASILNKLIPITAESVDKSVIRAQYEGYKNTHGVDDDSQTETYFELKAYLDHDSWKGVPFYITAGKSLKEEKVCVEIYFYNVAIGPFETNSSAKGNVIVLNISPEQAMHITLNVKKPGHSYEIESHTLSYVWDTQSQVQINAYEKVLLDCIMGDQTIFTRAEEVLASWKFITSILDTWDTIELQTYKKGSEGPDRTLHRDLSL